MVPMGVGILCCRLGFSISARRKLIVLAIGTRGTVYSNLRTNRNKARRNSNEMVYGGYMAEVRLLSVQQ